MDKDKTYPVREAPPPKPRRVYKKVSVEARSGDMFAVLLDGKPAMTPLRLPLASPSRTLAEAVAKEWDAQDPHVDPETMPLTRLLATALDRIAPQREAVIASLLFYVDADCICYRAAHPAGLRDRQKTLWQPINDWLLRAHDVALRTSEGLMPQTQGPDVAPRMRRLLETMNDSELTAFQAAAGLMNSLALAFAFVYGQLTAAEVFAAAFLDELYQVEKWGEDTAAKDRRRRIAADLDAIERYMLLTRA
jgi:chaperone required for assembly of F1-ATPase